MIAVMAQSAARLSHPTLPQVVFRKTLRLHREESGEQPSGRFDPVEEWLILQLKSLSRLAGILGEHQERFVSCVRRSIEGTLPLHATVARRLAAVLRHAWPAGSARLDLLACLTSVLYDPAHVFYEPAAELCLQYVSEDEWLSGKDIDRAGSILYDSRVAQTAAFRRVAEKLITLDRQVFNKMRTSRWDKLVDRVIATRALHGTDGRSDWKWLVGAFTRFTAGRITRGVNDVLARHRAEEKAARIAAGRHV